MVAGVPVTVSGGSHAAPKNTAKTTFFVWLLGFSAVIGGFLFGYDTGVVSSAMIYIPDYMNLTYLQTQLVVSVTIGFCAIFSLIGGPVNEYLGRKITIMIASFLFTVGAIIMSLSGIITPEEGFLTLIIGRGVVGSAIGFASMTVPSYVAECAPYHVRGTMVLSFQLMITFGIFMASILGGVFSLDFFDPKNLGWRFMLGTAGIPSIIQFIAFFFLPESPRWLVAHGRIEEARGVINRMYSEEDQEWREYEMAEMLEQQEEMEADKAMHGGGLVIITMLKTPHVRRALILGCAIQMFQQLGGINTLMYYTATIIRMSGFADPQTDIWLACAVSGTNFMFTFVPTLLVERMGRRPLLLISTIGVILSCLTLAGGFFGIATTAATVETQLNTTDYHYQIFDKGGSLFNLPNSEEERQALWEQVQLCAKYELVDGNNTYGTCLPAQLGKTDHSWFGLCNDTDGFSTTVGDNKPAWQWDYCTSPLSPIVLVGMIMYLISFSIGMGPMAWVINAEIYPNWARTTGNSLATFTNWAFNTLVAQTFLMMTVGITKWGTFLVFAGITVLGFIVFFIFVPETKGLQMEEVEKLFMTKEELEEENRRRDSHIDLSKQAFANGLEKEGEKALGPMKF